MIEIVDLFGIFLVVGLSWLMYRYIYYYDIFYFLLEMDNVLNLILRVFFFFFLIFLILKKFYLLDAKWKKNSLSYLRNDKGGSI